MTEFIGQIPLPVHIYTYVADNLPSFKVMFKKCHQKIGHLVMWNKTIRQTPCVWTATNAPKWEIAATSEHSKVESIPSFPFWRDRLYDATNTNQTQPKTQKQKQPVSLLWQHSAALVSQTHSRWKRWFVLRIDPRVAQLHRLAGSWATTSLWLDGQRCFSLILIWKCLNSALPASCWIL